MHKKILFITSAAAIFIASIYSGKEDTVMILDTNTGYRNIISDAEFEEYEEIIAEPQYFEIDNYTENKDALENYIIGVVSAEMPVDFHEEALKAQAVAARTYYVKCTGNIENIVPQRIYQSYYTVDQLKKRWGSNFDTFYEKIRKAVYDTQGIIMTYDNEAVTAVFHSMSGGMTESAKDVWGGELPYLVSTESHEEEAAPNFETTAVFNETDFKNKLISIDTNADLYNFTVTERSKAGYVKKVKAGDKVVSGDDIRRIFSLRSSCFEYYVIDGKAAFKVKGYGHGVGMSQYGAEYMAVSGSDYKDILKHYYKGVTLSKLV